jgi:hypothetical protein
VDLPDDDDPSDDLPAHDDDVDKLILPKKSRISLSNLR